MPIQSFPDPASNLPDQWAARMQALSMYHCIQLDRIHAALAALLALNAPKKDRETLAEEVDAALKETSKMLGSLAKEADEEEEAKEQIERMKVLLDFARTAKPPPGFKP